MSESLRDFDGIDDSRTTATTTVVADDVNVMSDHHTANNHVVDHYDDFVIANTPVEVHNDHVVDNHDAVLIANTLVEGHDNQRNNKSKKKKKKKNSSHSDNDVNGLYTDEYHQQQQKLQQRRRIPFLCLPCYYLLCCCLCIPNREDDDTTLNDSVYKGNHSDKEMIKQSQKINWFMIRKQFLLIGRLSYPYYKESRSSRWLLLLVLILMAGQNGVVLLFSYITRDYFNALGDRNENEFYRTIMQYAILMVIGVPIMTLYDYYKNILSLLWREWMTIRTVELFTTNQVYYKMERLHIQKKDDNTNKNKNNNGIPTVHNNDVSASLPIPEATSYATGKKPRRNKRERMMSEVIDNPDERITEDIKHFTSYSLKLLTDVLYSIVDLGGFSYVLYTINPNLLYICLLYAIVGTLITATIGRTLIYYNFKLYQREADLRYILIRLRDNSESIAFYNGEELETTEIDKRLCALIRNQRIVYRIQRNVDYFSGAYNLFSQIVPMLLIAPQYFAGEIEIGVIYQSVDGFNRILGDLSLFVYQFETLSTYSAAIERLSDFYETMKYADIYRRTDKKASILSPGVVIGGSSSIHPYSSFDGNNSVRSISTNMNVIDEESDPMRSLNVTGQVDVEESHGGIINQFGKIDLQRWKPLIYSDPPINDQDNNTTPILSLRNVDLCTPDKKRLLIQNLSLTIQPKEHLLIVGQSGIGKTSLMRAIAGLWQNGNGTIVRPADEDVYFLPQRPYCTVGTLKDQLLYPSTEYNYDDEQLRSSSSTTRFTSPRQRVLKESWNDEDLLDILDQVDLYDIAVRSDPDGGNPVRGLYAVHDWSNQLSLGEQQRLGFGRLLVNKPSLVVLDEATSALDVDHETKMYEILRGTNVLAQQQSEIDDYGRRKRTLGLTFISIGHRPTIEHYHCKQLRIADGSCEITAIQNYYPSPP